jgi:hypothetical protein
MESILFKNIYRNIKFNVKFFPPEKIMSYNLHNKNRHTQRKMKNIVIIIDIKTIMQKYN